VLLLLHHRRSIVAGEREGEKWRDRKEEEGKGKTRLPSLRSGTLRWSGLVAKSEKEQREGGEKRERKRD